MTKSFNTDDNIRLDNCWMNNKEENNQQMEKYALYYNDNAREENITGSFPNIAVDHINLRGRPGYGLSDDYLIDTYSSLRNNTESLTRDKCPIHLESRIFLANPKLKGQPGNIDRELDLLSGSDTRSSVSNSYSENKSGTNGGRGGRGGGSDGSSGSRSSYGPDGSLTQPSIHCNKSLMELQTHHFIPMLDNIKEVQNPNNIIMEQIRGGEDTRSYIHKLKFNKCNKNL